MDLLWGSLQTGLAIKWRKDSKISERYLEILGDRQADRLGHVGIHSAGSLKIGNEPFCAICRSFGLTELLFCVIRFLLMYIYARNNSDNFYVATRFAILAILLVNLGTFHLFRVWHHLKLPSCLK